MKIAEFDTNVRPLLIAEIGNNHEGDAALALEMADAAIDAGAGAVKIQIIDPVRLVNRSQAERIAQLERYRLPLDVFIDMGRRVQAKGGLFIASAFDLESLDAIMPHLDAVKIASGDLNFYPLLDRAAASGKPVILSTGMATLDEIREAVMRLSRALPADRTARDAVAILHCVSLYPTPPEQANLAAISTLRAMFDVSIGYSDHTLGTEAAVASLALGARIIEKHFTLDKTRATFRDHALSADPRDMKVLAESLRRFDAMMGHGDRSREMADQDTRAAARRSIVAARKLQAGAVLGEGDLDFVRPGDGLPPPAAASLLGKRLRRSVEVHEQLREADFE